MNPEDRAMTWDDITLLVRAAQRSKKDPEVVVSQRCNVDAATAKAWVAKVRAG